MLRSDTLESAVIDRIVDGQTAVLLVGEREEKFYCSVDKLPSDAEEGSWLQVKIVDGELLAAVMDHEKTAQVRTRIRSKMELLRQRGRRRTE